MIQINNRSIIGIHKGTREIMAVYKGTRLVWEKISSIFSCYSNGYWIDEYPWVDSEIWTD